tara:strand:+ start:148 stop:459 length:312 start_codon:yes stop_codon:yes gene_type:complete
MSKLSHSNPDLDDVYTGEETETTNQYFEAWSDEEGGDENSELRLTSEGIVFVSVAIEEICQEILGLDFTSCPDHSALPDPYFYNDLANVRDDLVEFLNTMGRK